MSATAYYAGFAGPDEGYGRRLMRLECWGAGGADENWAAASACRQQNLPQIRLEPLLKARAEELSPVSPVSRPALMRSVVTPVCVSPRAMAHCTGAAPRYSGGGEAWTLMMPCGGISRIDCGMIWTSPTTTMASGASIHSRVDRLGPPHTLGLIDRSHSCFRAS